MKRPITIFAFALALTMSLTTDAYAADTDLMEPSLAIPCYHLRYPQRGRDGDPQVLQPVPGGGLSRIPRSDFEQYGYNYHERLLTIGEKAMRSKDPELMEKIKAFAEDYYKEHGETPSNRTIANAMGIGRFTVYYYLVEMARRNIISFVDDIIFFEKIEKFMQPVNRAELVRAAPMDRSEFRRANIVAYIIRRKGFCLYAEPAP